jgi:tetratricopeptide (TPR) repeat protein
VRYLAGGLAAFVAFPVAAVAQEDCAEGGNSAIRSAEVEFSLAASRNDTRSKEDRYRRAIEKLEPNWELDNIPSRSYLLAANAYLGLFDLVGADTMLSILVQVEPVCADQAAQIRFNAWVTQYNSAIELMQAGDEETALERFERANTINRDSRSLAYAGSIYQTRGELGPAADRYVAALEVGGSDDIVRTASINLAGIRKRDGDLEGALQIYSDFSTAYPDDILGRLNFAIALMDAERQDEAQQVFEDLLARDDLSFGQWSQVGIGLYRAQNFAPAATAFRRALDLGPYNKETLENLANSHYQSELYEELLPLAQELVDRYPLERVNLNLLANARRELGDYDGALAAIEARDRMSFEFLRMQLSVVGETTYSIDGQLMNRSGAAGSSHSVTVTFIGEDGTPLFTELLELTLPAEQETAAFSLQVESDAFVSGFSY